MFETRDSHSATSAHSRVTPKGLFIGLGAGILVEVIGLLAAVASGGAGHGHYVEARILFPLTMASTYTVGSISVPSIILAILQYPLYGVLAAMGLRNRNARSLLWTLLVLHVAVAALMFMFPNLAFA